MLYRDSSDCAGRDAASNAVGDSSSPKNAKGISLKDRSAVFF